MSSRLSTRRAVIPFLASAQNRQHHPDIRVPKSEDGPPHPLPQRTERGELTRRDIGVVMPQELFAPERLQTLQHPVPDPSTPDRSDDFTLEVKRVSSDIGNVPFSLSGLIVRRDKVADEREDRHHDVFGDRHDVRAGHLLLSGLPFGRNSVIVSTERELSL